MNFHSQGVSLAFAFQLVKTELLKMVKDFFIFA